MKEDRTGTDSPRRRLRIALRILAVLPFALLIGAYQYYFQPAVFEERVIQLVREAAGIEMRASFVRSSLFYGFEANDIELTEPESGLPLLRAKRIRLSYFLPAVLIGEFGIRDLTLEDPELHLIRQDGVMNWSRLGSDEPEEDDEPGETPDEIELPIAVRTYARIVVTNFSLHYRDEVDGEIRERADIRNVNLNLGTITKRVDRIPLDLNALGLFETFIVALNPHSPIEVNVQGDRSINGTAALSLFLFHDRSQSEANFVSRLHAKTRGLLIRNPQGSMRPDIELFYDIAYDAPNDRVRISSLDLRGERQTWLAMRAQLDEVTGGDRALWLKVDKSDIRLGYLGRVISAASGGDTRSFMEGNVNIHQLELNGRLDELNVAGRIDGNGLRFGSETFRNVHIDLTALLDAYGVLGFIDPPADYQPDQHLAFGVIKELAIPELSLIYNGASINGTATIQPLEGIRAKLHLANYRLHRLLPEYMYGFGGADINVRSDESFERIGFDGVVRVAGARYFLDRSRSGSQDLRLQASGAFLTNPQLALEINDMLLLGYNESGQSMLRLKADGRLNFSPAPGQPDEQDYRINLQELSVNYERLRPTLPGSIRYELQPYQTYLSGGLRLSSQTRLRFGGPSTRIDGKTDVDVPYLRLDDLELTHDVVLGDRRISFDRVQIAGLRGALNARVGGELTRPDIESAWVPDVDAQVSIERPERFRVHENILLQGRIDLGMQLNHNVARGRLFADHVNVEYLSSPCNRDANDPDCVVYRLEELNADLPFVHDVAWTDPIRLSQNPGKIYVQTYGLADTPNLSLKAISSNRNPRGEIQPDYPFYYIGAPTGRGEPGLRVRLDYRNNVLIGDNLRVRLYSPDRQNPNGSWKSGGTIDSRELYANLANLSAENMEAGLNLQIKSLDLEPFLPRSKSSYDGRISADARMETSNLAEPLYNTNALVSVHRISDEFSGFVTRILMPAEIVAFAVRRTLEIPSMRVELKGGLVYSQVDVRRVGLGLGILVSPSADEIKQERMPLAQFLERAAQEVSDFSERGPGSEPAATE